MKTTIKRKEIKYNKIVNFDPETKEITVLDYIFDHGNGFKGATGSKFVPVSKDEYDQQTEEDNIIEYLIGSGCDLPDQYKRGGFNAWVDAIIDAGEEGELMYDYSYMNLWDMMRDELGLTEDEAYKFNCVGGGRCFDKKFKGNVNPELSKEIRKAETK